MLTIAARGLEAAIDADCDFVASNLRIQWNRKVETRKKRFLEEGWRVVETDLASSGSGERSRMMEFMSRGKNMLLRMMV